MTDETWYGSFDDDGNKVICKCPTCASTELTHVGWVDGMKREKLLKCKNCGTKF